MVDATVRSLIEQMGYAFIHGVLNRVGDANITLEVGRIGDLLRDIHGLLLELTSHTRKGVAYALDIEVMNVLQKENTALVASLSERDRRLDKMFCLVRDLGSPCIGCKKQSWTPHKEDCPWAVSNNELRRLLDAQTNDQGTPESTDS